MTPAGKLIRLPLAFVPDNQIVRIMSGINRANVRSRTGPNRACRLGSYEQNHFEALPRIIKP